MLSLESFLDLADDARIFCGFVVDLVSATLTLGFCGFCVALATLWLCLLFALDFLLVLLAVTFLLDVLATNVLEFFFELFDFAVAELFALAVF